MSEDKLTVPEKIMIVWGMISLSFLLIGILGFVALNIESWITGMTLEQWLGIFVAVGCIGLLFDGLAFAYYIPYMPY